MTGKNHMIVSAATNMFVRYGYAKTTMGDIAAEAGVARQTLYNAFPGKEEILRAVVRQAVEATHQAVIVAWADAGTVDAKLAAFQDLGPTTWFEVMRSSPDWASLMEGVHAAASDELSVSDAKWRASLMEMFIADLPQDHATSDTLTDVVDFFYSASLNAKYGVRDVEHLRTRLTTIRAATLVLLNA